MASNFDILVLGAESTGTRYMTGLFVRLGFTGDPDHIQLLDSISDFSQVDGNIVFRRSFPHSRQWPDMDHLVERFKGRNRYLKVVVCHRDLPSTIRSQVANGHVGSFEESLRNINKAYKLIYSNLCDLSYFPISLNAICSDIGGQILRKTLEMIGVEVPDGFDFKINKSVIANRLSN